MGKAVNRGFDKVSGGKGPSKSADWVPMLQERPKDKPFFLVCLQRCSSRLGAQRQGAALQA